MNSVEQATRPSEAAFNIVLGVVFAMGIVFTVFMFATSWGGTSWVFGSVVSVVVSGIALVRERYRLATVLAGLVATAAAVVVSLRAGGDLPQEPAPVTAFALAVLVGSALRALPAAPAAGIAVGGVAVIVVIWFNGVSGVTALATLAMAVALVLGPALRGPGHRVPADAPVPQDS